MGWFNKAVAICFVGCQIMRPRSSSGHNEWEARPRIMARAISLAAIFFLLTGCAGAQPTPATQPSAAPPGPGQSAMPATMPMAGATTAPDVDPLADRILRDSCDYLAHVHAFTVHAEVWKDEVLPAGHKIQVTRSIDLDLRRPDHFHVVERAHHKGRAMWDDGKTLTVLDLEHNLYGTVDAPATVDQAVDTLAEDYCITVPLEDMLVADPYGSAMKHVNAGGYFGDEPVLGVSCRHIGFSTDRIDWQLWVANGPQPLPQKLVITYKNEEQSPQFIAIFSKWNLLDRASSLAFEFIPPPGSSSIPMLGEADRHHKDENGDRQPEGKP
jgi:hypothetical protein